MIRVYYLETKRLDNTDTVVGAEYVRDAILGVEGTLRKLIQDTTDSEHTGLAAVAKTWRKAEVEESVLLTSLSHVPSAGARDLAAEVDEIRSRLAELEARTSGLRV